MGEGGWNFSGKNAKKRVEFVELPRVLMERGRNEIPVSSVFRFVRY
jgi:hypothetical protein